MIEHDYIEEIIQKFVAAVMEPLRRALAGGDLAACETVEQQIAEMLSLSSATAMNLAPESLCTMMLLSGIGDSVAGYTAWSMLRLADAYDMAGQPQIADLRRAQAEAVAREFMWDINEAPKEFEDLDAEIREQLG